MSENKIEIKTGVIAPTQEVTPTQDSVTPTQDSVTPTETFQDPAPTQEVKPVDPIAETKTIVKTEDMTTLPAVLYRAQLNLKVGGVRYAKGDAVHVTDEKLLKELLEKKYVL